MNPQVRIGRMRLRVPGSSREQGEALAEALRERLGQLSPTSSGHLGQMRLRIASGETGASTEAVADSVVSAVSSKLANPHLSSSSHA